MPETSLKIPATLVALLILGTASRDLNNWSQTAPTSRYTAIPAETTLIKDFLYAEPTLTIRPSLRAAG